MSNVPKKLIKIGFMLSGVALLGIIYLFYPVIYQEIKYRLADRNISDVSLETAEDNTKTIVAVDKDFSIIIPKIGANAKVIKNVNPFDSYEYRLALRDGVAHAKGTKYPGQAGNTFLFAHSTDNFYNANRYNSVFYLLNKMEIGDEFYFAYSNDLFEYVVEEIKVVDKDAIEYLDGTMSKKTATLMTCWPAGTTKSRLVVIGTLQE